MKGRGRRAEELYENGFQKDLDLPDGEWPLSLKDGPEQREEAPKTVRFR